MIAITAIFFVKAVLLALFVTPLWDVPDETGHYALIADLADGRGFAIPGKSVLPPDVVTNWAKGRALSADERWNWMAYHPPLYHLLEVPFLQVARTLTGDPRWLYRAPRVGSALMASATLLVLFLVFWEASLDPMFAFASAASVGFLPMFSHMSSGTNHDALLALLCAAAGLSWVRLSRSGRFSDGLKMGAALTLAGATKFSALAVSVALLLTSWSWLRSRGSRRFFEWLTIAGVSVSLSVLWALRHLVLLGNLRLRPVSGKAFRLESLISYLRDNPVVDHSFKNFVGLIGWTASGAGHVRWFQISGVFLAPYLGIALLATASAIIWLWKSNRGFARWIAGTGSAVLFLFVVFRLVPHDTPLLKRLLYGLLGAAPLLALPRLAAADAGPEERVIGASQAVFLLFSAAYLVNSWEAYEIYGQMRATNGRYFFAVLPFLGLAFLLPAVRLWRPSARRVWSDGPSGNKQLLLALVVTLALHESAFFLLRVFPFYRSEAIRRAPGLTPPSLTFGSLALPRHDHPEVGLDPVPLEQVVFERDQPRQGARRVLPEPLHVETREDEPEDVPAVRPFLDDLEESARRGTDRARPDRLRWVIDR